MFKRKLALVWVGIGVLSSMFLMGQASWLPCEPVYFPDPNLELKVREALFEFSGDICSPILAPLNLNASFSGISDLSGLEHWAALTGLDLQGNEVSDITPLTGLVNLTYYLLLHSNQVSDISSLAGLTNLTQLGFSSNQVSDISPVAGLTSLTELQFSNNQVTDISPVAGLTSLNWLILSSNQVSDILPIVNNTGIDSGDYVYLEGNPLSTPSCTVYIPELESRGVTVYHDCP